MFGEFFHLPYSTRIVGDLQCTVTILTNLHEMDARSFYGTRRATKATTIAEAYDAIQNNKNVLNVVVLPPISSDLGSKENDCQNVISDIKGCF